METTPSKDTQVPQNGGTVTLFTDYDHICLTVDEFTELVKARASLDILQSMYMAFESYDHAKVLSAFFGAKKEKDDA